jgi:hypothetical protein
MGEQQAEHANNGFAFFNPHNKPMAELPVIYGFNNGGSPGFMYACLIAEDGTGMGSHLCSNEGYMPHDLGCVECSRPDRHEGFRDHYPDGYRMEFVGGNPRQHAGIMAAVARGQERAKAQTAQPA